MGAKIIISENSGFCFGVKRAVEKALLTQKALNKPIYTLGPLIHNESVISHLKDHKITPVDIENLSSLKKDDTIIIRSHGISKDVYITLKEKELNIVDLTCPFVSHIQKKVNKYYELGYSIIIVGDPNHPEIKGINGWCDNNALVFKNGDVTSSLPKKVCIVAQTTEKQENFEKVMYVVSKECKEFLAFNTICSATETRQKDAFNISKESDKMIVIGGKNSSNTNKLYEICKSNCKDTIHIETAKELPFDFFKVPDSTVIGITAGASTPSFVIDEVLNKISEEKHL
ncbi:4-hydroxy-3-methylbut-2-enyl diphosphate reductase [Clostridium algidicarnis]|uniref:4-hydroxy-3-methylbut-2-enyl diphosphate reductase n=1 Tax=Clostridium algidicarnis DSM 15099 TaxID=1121295 RepID=A0A2S6FXT0_9CLOT|nr:4-hydroxy-3-methylbut-2-enyl diphosphate reductase [Clostridium algidicarnis]MBB6630159.1 4-hydroxy-3-methylbut-2-enyl diphosphate reductase [Clostridium algidicarnis]MBB6697533.1 4-hydroxy-3-methylbut-2-enyl diphosphate reductase [Clostridium algidicarnis]PPK48413.1 4-hydroxy-3-methylbut-2-enyl diphosphate reductase [Clostridium algidicarnis DSM 15099]